MLIWRPGVSKAVRIPAKVEPGWRRVIYIILGRERAENASPADEKNGWTVHDAFSSSPSMLAF